MRIDRNTVQEYVERNSFITTSICVLVHDLEYYYCSSITRTTVVQYFKFYSGKQFVIYMTASAWTLGMLLRFALARLHTIIIVLALSAGNSVLCLLWTYRLHVSNTATGTCVVRSKTRVTSE